MTEERTHISDEMWKKYAQGTLSTKEEEKLYTHVGCCTYCAERFANIVEKNIQEVESFVIWKRVKNEKVN